jgi:UDP-GlcNAc:undecaprenyl-phosphate/decaprenyl-phosphate GlcNAc-1-phosphate transferase
VLTYLVALLLAGMVAAAMTPLAARLAYRIGAVDRPGEARKIHSRPIPRIGGLAVAVGFFAPIVGLAIYTNDISNLIYTDLRLVAALIAGASAILILGVYDDVRGADAKLKLAVQIPVAIGLWVAGFRIDLLGVPLVGAFHTSFLSLPLTVLWMVGVINALNLIDGLDGLAAGVALFASIVLFGVAFMDRAVLLCVVACALGGSLAGFLFFNFNPAKIFLGDSGSMFLGFILASISIWTQRKGATAAALLIPVVALGLPLLDTGLSLVRRLARGQNPFRADKEHLHHKLLASGLSHRHAVLTLYTLSGVFALGALAMLDNDTTRRSIALATVGAAALILMRQTGVFSRARDLRPTEIPSERLRDEARRVARRVRTAETIDAAWAVLTSLGPSLGCAELRLEWNVEPGDGSVFRWAAHSSETWRLDSTLTAYDTARSLPLEEDGTRYGSLTFLVERASPPKTRQHEDGALEILRDALIDLALADRMRSQDLAPSLASGPRLLRLPLERG